MTLPRFTYRKSVDSRIICKKRKVLKWLIDVTCHLANRELPFRAYDEVAVT